MVMLPTIKTDDLANITGAGGSSGITHALSHAPAITGTATKSLVKLLGAVHRPGFDFAIAK
jgi:hypothetical protein